MSRPTRNEIKRLKQLAIEYVKENKRSKLTVEETREAIKSMLDPSDIKDLDKRFEQDGGEPFSILTDVELRKLAYDDEDMKFGTEPLGALVDYYK